MKPVLLARRPEDWSRIASYVLGAAWAVLFLVYTPTSYAPVISSFFTVGWSVLVLSGCLAALFGALTGRDTKVELGGLYLILLGMLLYFVAQIGFLQNPPPGAKPFDRYALMVYIVWHSSLVLPRVAALESYRRAVHRRARSEP